MRDAGDTHRLPAETYLTALERETRRFREVLADAPSGAEVPSCPDWDVEDLLWHLGGEVQAFWAYVVAVRPEAPHDWEEPDRPDGRSALLDVLDRSHEDLVRRLRGAHPTDPAWSWADDPRLHTVGFTMRRQAHEALIHRVDAELATGQRTPLDPQLATDGVVECLEWMYGEHPAWGSFDDDGRRVVIETTDTGRRVLIALGRTSGHDPEEGVDVDEDDLRVLDVDLEVDAGGADVTITGPAEGLDLWLWHRGPAEPLTMTGDPQVLDDLTAILGQPID